MRRIAAVLPLLALAFAAQAQTPHNAPVAAPYAGLQTREIKSLSADDIAELRRGGGWALALPAELNAVPGPAHLLELRDQLGLTADQTAKIEAMFARMRTEAQAAGERFIRAEADIEAAFRAGGVPAERLRALIDAAGAARNELRFVHLSRHSETLPLLTQAQIESYKALRGYAADPCANVPPGHDAAMWLRHNSCARP